MNIDEIERIRTAMSINEQARYKRKGGDDMTDQERKSYDCAKHDVMVLQAENRKLREAISKLTEQQNGTIIITADTINHVLDRVASVTFRK